MMDLDDVAALRARDPGGMLDALATFEGDFRAAYLAAAKHPVRLPKGVTHVLVTGMGGSGIGGNLLATLLKPESSLPVLVHKGYGAPAYVGTKTLLVAVSYSGETEETLDATLEAKKRGASLIGVSSGGRLERLVRSAGGSHLAVPPGRQPRAALPHLLGTLLGAATALGLTTAKPETASLRQLRSLHTTLRVEAPEAKNRAKAWARGLHDRFPVLYGTPLLGAVALRGRCQLNENAKMLARNDELPEGNHNDLVPWNAVEAGDRFFVGVLRAAQEPPEIQKRLEFLAAVLRRKGVPSQVFEAPDASPLAQVLGGLLFVDYVSVYAAILGRVDPTDVSIIADLKKVLARDGRAPALWKQIPA